MNTMLKKLLSLNLALVMLVMLLPVTAWSVENETGAYVYVNVYSNGAPSEEHLFSDDLDLDSNVPGFSCYTDGGISLPYGQFCGWSLTPGGMPVSSAEDLPAPEDGEPIRLYICWGYQRYYVASTSSLFDFTDPQWVYSAAQVGDRQLRFGGSDSGTGWWWDGWRLHLTADYEGEPIRAAKSINILTWGNAVIRGSSGPAITAGGSVILENQPGAALTVIGGENSPAVLAEELYAMRPCSAEFLSGGSGVPAVSVNAMEPDGTDYTPSDEAANSALHNLIYVGQDADTAVIGSYDAEPYLRLETARIAVTFDPQGGTISGLAEGETKSESVPYSNGMPEPPEVTCPGKMLMGWSLNSSGSYRYIREGGKLALSGDSCTVYAIWQDIPEKYVLLDAGNSYIDDPAFLYRPTWLLALEDGQAKVPRIHNAYIQAWSADSEPTECDDFTVADPALYYPEWTYDLSEIRILYPAEVNSRIRFEYFRSISGNGRLSNAGTPQILVGGWSATPTSLLPYVSEYFGNDPEYIPVSLNTMPDGSGEFREDRDCYVIWESAPAGSYVLDASWQDHHSAKVILPSEAEDFNWSDSYGLTRFGNTFSGWSASRNELIQELPEADAFGRYHLYPVWAMNQITLIGMDGAEYASAAASCFLPEAGRTDLYDGYILLGWNSAPDGSGDWYSGTVTPDTDLTLYGQFENLHDARLTYVLLKYPDHWVMQRGTLRAEELCVEVTLPDDVQYWYADEDGCFDGYLGGRTYSIPCHTRLSEYTGTRFFSEYPLHSGAEFGTVRTKVTTSSLIVYMPTADDYDAEAGKELAGWTTDVTRINCENFFAGAGSYSRSFKLQGSDYYAIWDDADTVYLSLKDADGTVLKELRTTAGNSVILPRLDKLGWRLVGWSDSGGQMYDAGSGYTVTRDASVLTAVWEARSSLTVDGAEYAVDGSSVLINGVPATSNEYYEWSNTSADGWAYQNGNLYLRNYSGGEIYLPDDYPYLYFSGVNTVQGTDAAPAVTARNSLYISTNGTRKAGDRLTVTGGAGQPALRAKWGSVSSGQEIACFGGANAPAVLVDQYINLTGGHTVLQGGNCPAVVANGNYGYAISFNSNSIHCFAGDAPESAEELAYGRDYTSQPYIATQPICVTLTLDACGGTYQGRSVWTEVLEKGDSYRLSDPELRHGAFLGWNSAPDGSGTAYSWSVYPDSDLTLYACWECHEADKLLRLDYNRGGIVTAFPITGSGDVTLPAAPDVPEYNQYFCNWYVSGENFCRFPAGVPLPQELFEDGMTLRAEYCGENEHIALYMANGTTLNGTFCDRGWTQSDSLSLWWASVGDNGFPMLGWNTVPDGSGELYPLPATYTFAQGERIKIFYAQYAPQMQYVTKTDNERLPYDEQGSYVCWINADHTALFGSGEACGQPAGTVYELLYDYIHPARTVILHSNIGTADDYLLTRITRYSNLDNGIYVSADGIGFRRDGYVLTGWNTAPNGSGTAYDLTFRIRIGEVSSDGRWYYDEALITQLPANLYAQWEKLPDLVVQIPQDMKEIAQERNSRLLIALYDQDGRFCEYRMVDADADGIPLYSVEASMTYMVLLCDQTAWFPLTREETGVIS